MVVIIAAIIIVGILVLLLPLTVYQMLLETQDRNRHIHLHDTYQKGPVTYCPLFSHEEIEAGAIYLVAQSLSAVKRQGQDLNPNLNPCHFAGSMWVTAWLPQRITGHSSCLAPPGTLLSQSAENLASVLCCEL